MRLRPFLALGKGLVWGSVLRTASASISRSSALVFAGSRGVGFHEVMTGIWGCGEGNSTIGFIGCRHPRDLECGTALRDVGWIQVKAAPGREGFCVRKHAAPSRGGGVAHSARANAIKARARVTRHIC